MLPINHAPKTSWDLEQLTTTTDKWIRKARENNVDIDEEVSKIVQTINMAPQRSPETQNLQEVTVVQQLMLRGMYCSRIIRKIAEAEIKSLASAGRADPALKSKVSLINDCERWALDHLPSMWRLGDPSSTEHAYYVLKDKIGEMVGKIRNKL